MIRRPLLALLAGAALVTLAPSHASQASMPAPVRIGFLGTDVSSGPLYAEASGAYARAGIVPVLKQYRKAYEPLAALKSGAIDVGFSDIISAVHAIETGVPVVILASAAIYDSRDPITVLLAPKDRPIRSGADLNGKTLAVPAPRDLGEIATRNWIDKHGGDDKTVHYVHTIAFTDIAHALNGGAADAAEMSEPIKTEIASQTSFVAATFDDIAPRFVIGVFLARTAWIAAHPALAKKFAVAMSQAAHWANAHHAATAQILAKRYHTPPAVIATMVRATYPERLTSSLVQPVVDVAARFGVVRPIDAATLLR
jgi:ABC-type nitrate/sulfonate/bicarbonate transport system substrate-binding protein